MTHTSPTPLLVHVIGARPNIPKAAPVIEALGRWRVEQLLVHTGQHYDERMSEIFFRQLGLRDPDVNLGVGSAPHGAQTAAIMVGLEELFIDRRPDLVVVYGDVNSTVAAALVAAKMQVPVAHVEAGLRSFDRTMPEEINRMLTDRVCDLLLATSADAVAHLGREGADPDSIHLVGNPMIDTLLRHLDDLDTGAVAAQVGLDAALPYVVATLHRPFNVDDPADVTELVHAVHAVADQAPLLLPMHPRGRGRLIAAGLAEHNDVLVVDPLGYLEFLSLVKGAAAVVTDSGGVQEETTVMGVPCLTMRPSTERPVTITHGTNRLVTRTMLPRAVAEVLATGRPENWPVPPLWDGHASSRIATLLARYLDVDYRHDD